MRSSTWSPGGSTGLENLVLLVTVGPMTTFGLKQHAPESATWAATWAAAFSTG